MVATSLMNSSPSPFEFSSIFTATGTPFGNSPLYTLPNPPVPSLCLNRFVILFTSENVYLVGLDVPNVLRNISTFSCISSSFLVLRAR
uniref:Uncharacterized protein n=1 Tax=Oryza brachyantha TaxID=4533 RepID=J3KVU3_ORYBR